MKSTKRLVACGFSLLAFSCVSDAENIGFEDSDGGSTTEASSFRSATAHPRLKPSHGGGLDTKLARILRRHRFTGTIEKQLERRLGRRLDPALADLGRNLWFDRILGLNDDNSCSGCHSPAAGFGDVVPIAIGIESNNIVGPNRTGPRNQRRSPMVINTAFFRSLMWNGRFSSVNRDPFDNSGGFTFPLPEGTSLSGSPTLLHAQAFIPPTERVEVAGFGPHVPDTNDGIRSAVVERLNASPGYQERFADVFAEVARGEAITYDMIALALAEFEMDQTYATAPIDLFARGYRGAMSVRQKRGAMVFFGKGKCSTCHAVSRDSNEMFSDFEMHNIGVPQIMPTNSNMTFDGPDSNEDYGLEQVTGMLEDRYLFRTSPIRNVSLQPAFFHNGSFTDLRAAIAHHLDPIASARSFTADHLPADLRGPRPSTELVLETLDPVLQEPLQLSSQEFDDLYHFVAFGLLDRRATPNALRDLIPKELPSGNALHVFE